jgi:hypothetical protein
MYETVAVEKDEHALIQDFDDALESIKKYNAEAAKAARKLKEQYISKGKRIAGQGWEAFLASRDLTTDQVDKWIIQYERKTGLRPLPEASSRQTARTNILKTKDYSIPPAPVKNNYIPLGKNEKGQETYAMKAPGWGLAKDKAVGPDSEFYQPSDKVEPDPIDTAVERIQESATVEWVAVQIADLIIVRLSMLRSMDDRRAAMLSAIGMVRHQRILPQVKEATD